MFEVPEATEVHQKLVNPKVPSDPGGALEALFTSGKVPRQAEHDGELLHGRAGPLTLLGRPDALPVQPVRCGKSLRDAGFGPL